MAEICRKTGISQATFYNRKKKYGGQAKALRPGRRRELVDTVRKTWQVSIPCACDVLKAERSSYHYKSRRGDQADLKKRIKEIAETRVRYGYRRIHVLLVREGRRVNV